MSLNKLNSGPTVQVKNQVWNALSMEIITPNLKKQPTSGDSSSAKMSQGK